MHLQLGRFGSIVPACFRVKILVMMTSPCFLNAHSSLHPSLLFLLVCRLSLRHILKGEGNLCNDVTQLLQEENIALSILNCYRWIQMDRMATEQMA